MFPKIPPSLKPFVGLGYTHFTLIILNNSIKCAKGISRFGVVASVVIAYIEVWHSYMRLIPGHGRPFIAQSEKGVLSVLACHKRQVMSPR